jgi:hypothetical protein
VKPPTAVAAFKAEKGAANKDLKKKDIDELWKKATEAEKKPYEDAAKTALDKYKGLFIYFCLLIYHYHCFCCCCYYCYLVEEKAYKEKKKAEAAEKKKNAPPKKAKKAAK